MHHRTGSLECGMHAKERKKERKRVRQEQDDDTSVYSVHFRTRDERKADDERMMQAEQERYAVWSRKCAREKEETRLAQQEVAGPGYHHMGTDDGSQGWKARSQDDDWYKVGKTPVPSEYQLADEYTRGPPVAGSDGYNLEHRKPRK